VKFQKLLIVLAIFNLISFIAMFDPFSAITLLTIVIGFVGAVRRSPRHLRCYGVTSIILTIIFVGLLAFFALRPPVPPTGCVVGDSGNGVTTPALPIHPVPSDPNTQAQPLSTPQGDSDTPSTPQNIPQTTEESEQHKGNGPVLLYFIAGFAATFTAIIKLITIVMSFRLACAIKKEQVTLAQTKDEHVPAVEMEMNTPEAPMGYPQVIYVPVPVNPQQGMTPFAFPQDGQPVFYNPYLANQTN